jgi:hypothetical protein
MRVYSVARAFIPWAVGSGASEFEETQTKEGAMFDDTGSQHTTKHRRGYLTESGGSPYIDNSGSSKPGFWPIVGAIENGIMGRKQANKVSKHSIVIISPNMGVPDDPSRQQIIQYPTSTSHTNISQE